MKMMQLVVFEITQLCNRGAEHAACPNMHPDRWSHTVGRRPMTDYQIVSTALEVRRRGFAGHFAFHYYCEPLMDWPRIQRVAGRIREQDPGATFLLWTNADLLPENLQELADVFCRVVVTNYGGHDLSRLREVCPSVGTVGPGLDWRLNPPTHDGPERCMRPFLELVFDFYGGVRACCYDWRGEIQIGNIHDEPLDDILAAWERMRVAVGSTPMAADAPERCRRCGTRYVRLDQFVPEAAARAEQYMQERDRC